MENFKEIIVLLTIVSLPWGPPYRAPPLGGPLQGPGKETGPALASRLKLLYRPPHGPPRAGGGPRIS